MGDPLGTLVGTFVSGIVVGLPAFMIVTLIQRLREKRFFGWGYCIISATAVTGASGLVLTLAPTSTLAGIAGILLFPFLLSILVVNVGLARKRRQALSQDPSPRPDSEAAPTLSRRGSRAQEPRTARSPGKAAQAAKPKQSQLSANQHSRNAGATKPVNKSGKSGIGLFIRKTAVVLFLVFFDGLLILGAYIHYHRSFPDPVAETDSAASDRSYSESGDMISHFKKTIRVQKDGSMVINDTITARVTPNSTNIQHGIRMTLAGNLSPAINNRAPISHFFDQDKRHIGYTIQQIASYRIQPGKPDKTLHNDHTPSEHVIYGDDETTICFWCNGPPLKAGRYRYQLVYQTQAALNTGDQRDVLFWPVTGRDGWDIPIKRAEATVLLPPGVSVENARAWKQKTKETVKSVPIKTVTTDDGTKKVTVDVSSGLPPGGSVSVALELPHGQIEQRSTSGAPSLGRISLLCFIAILLTFIGLVFVLG